MSEVPCDDGFIIVSKKKSCKPKKQNNIYGSSTFEENSDIFNKKVLNAKQEIESSDFFKSLLGLLIQSAEGTNCPISNIVCFGLGSVSSSKTSLFQLALLLCLGDQFKCSVEVYDPIFNESEKKLLSSLKLHVPLENCEGRKKQNSTNSTLFFLPHCPRELSNNLLFANWDPDQLRCCIIYANSFEKLCLNTPDRFLKDYQYLLKAKDLVKEVVPVNNFHFSDIFNDLSIHTFPNCSHLPEEFWDSPAPLYSEESELVLS